IDNVRRIGARAERRRAGLELERTPAAEAISDTVGFRRHLPRIREKIPAGLLCDTMPVEPRQYAQFNGAARCPPQIGGDGAAFLDRDGSAELQTVAGFKLAALMAAEGAERIRRPAAKHHGHIYAAADRDIGARALLQKVEGERLARLHAKTRP